MTEITNEQTQVLCDVQSFKDRRGSADLLSSVRWFGSVKRDRMRIKRNRAAESNQLVDSIQSEGAYLPLSFRSERCLPVKCSSPLAHEFSCITFRLYRGFFFNELGVAPSFPPTSHFCRRSCERQF